jgi:uncharacterized repeat protein (TIGR01451 family)
VETPVTPKIDLSIDKIDSKDPVKPGETFTYTVTVTNHGPSNATGVTVIDTLPATGVTFVDSSISPDVGSGDLSFDLGNLAAGASTTFTITVQVLPTFTGTLLNLVEVSGNEIETNYDNNEDSEPTLVKLDPATLAGYVYVDKNKNGVKEAGEKPLANVVMTLSGTDFTGTPVSRTTTTDANGRYSFANLMPGQYNVTEPNQPAGYKDGADTPGITFNELGTPLGIPNGFPPVGQEAGENRDADALHGINLDGGFAALDYNFGELAVTTSKVDFIRPLRFR